MPKNSEVGYQCSQKNSLSCLESYSLNWQRFERNFSHLRANGLVGESVCVLNSDICGHIRKFLAGFGIADSDGLCLVNFGGFFLFECFHHV